MKTAWISVKKKKPVCSRDSLAPGVSVLIWPRNPDDDMVEADGQAFYGRRATGNRATFYKFGRVIRGVTHWMPMPEGPSD